MEAELKVFLESDRYAECTHQIRKMTLRNILWTSISIFLLIHSHWPSRGSTAAFFWQFAVYVISFRTNCLHFSFSKQSLLTFSVFKSFDNVLIWRKYTFRFWGFLYKKIWKRNIFLFCEFFISIHLNFCLNVCFQVLVILSELQSH